jgi:transcriptional regulator with XRE-family HTH domain
MSEFFELIGQQIKAIRDTKGLKQEDLAERINSGRPRISDIEKGKKNITLATLETIMNALEITPYELFDFQKYINVAELKEKKLILDAHKYMLMERQLDDVKYVIRSTKDYLDTIDAKSTKQKGKK